MSNAINAHERWLDSIADVPPNHEVTKDVKEFISDVIDRRTHNDDETVNIDEITKEVIEEYPDVDGFELESYLQEVIK